MRKGKELLEELAEHCYIGACNPRGILRSLAEALAEYPEGFGSVEYKIVLGQLSYLCGESLGPTMEALKEFKDKKSGLIDLNIDLNIDD